MKKKVVCFGDSNTWGYNAATHERYDFHLRWTGVLQNELGDEYSVIEEGLNGRMTVLYDLFEPGEPGCSHLFTVMNTHKPFDLIIIMLGTNDLSFRSSASALEIAKDAAALAKEAMTSDCGPGGSPPKVLLASPIRVEPAVLDSWFGDTIDPDCITRSQEFDYRYSTLAHEIGCYYINAGEYASADPFDGVHISREGHKSLGLAMAEKVRGILNEN